MDGARVDPQDTAQAAERHGGEYAHERRESPADLCGAGERAYEAQVHSHEAAHCHHALFDDVSAPPLEQPKPRDREQSGRNVDEKRLSIDPNACFSSIDGTNDGPGNVIGAASALGHHLVAPAPSALDIRADIPGRRVDASGRETRAHRGESKLT